MKATAGTNDEQLIDDKHKRTGNRGEGVRPGRKSAAADGSSGGGLLERSTTASRKENATDEPISKRGAVGTKTTVPVETKSNNSCGVDRTCMKLQKPPRAHVPISCCTVVKRVRVKQTAHNAPADMLLRESLSHC